MQITEANCKQCGTAQRPDNFAFSTPDFWYGVPGEFSLYQCHNCGLYFQFPYPTLEEIDSFYPTSYSPYERAIEDEPSLFSRLNRQYAQNKRVRLLQGIAGQTGSVLDVGCATGVLLDGLRQHGWTATGVELNDEAAAYGRDRFGLDIKTGTLETVDLPPNSFDLVMMWNVLEHVPDPAEALAQLNTVTKTGGRLVLNLPDPDSIEANLFKRFWGGWDQPRHLFIFPTPLIKQILAQHGWRFEQKISYGGRFFLFRLSLFHWLDNKIGNKNLVGLLKKILGSAVFKVLTLPWFMFTDGIKRGSVMVIVAQKVG